jgi:hypothetical protein
MKASIDEVSLVGKGLIRQTEVIERSFFENIAKAT